MQTKQIASLFPLTGGVFSCRSPENRKRLATLMFLFAPALKKNRKPLALLAHTVPQSFGLLPRLHRIKDVLKINQYHLYLSISKGFVICNTEFKSFLLSYVLPGTAKLLSHTCEFLIYQAHDGTNHLQVLVFFTTGRRTWLPARICRERECVGPLVYLQKAQWQGSPNKHIMVLGRQYMCFWLAFEIYAVFSLTFKSICILHIDSHLLIAHLRILSPASWSEQEFKLRCGWLACWFLKNDFSFLKISLFGATHILSWALEVVEFYYCIRHITKLLSLSSVGICNISIKFLSRNICIQIKASVFKRRVLINSLFKK